MMLLIDIGNTNTVYSLYHNNNYTINKRITPEQNINTIIDELSDYNITHVAIASVVPKKTKSYLKLCKEHFDINPFILSYQNTNIKLKVDSQEEVGADRICNAKAAIKETSKNCLVIDFGTATTYDIINEKQEFIGGAIAPGIEVSALYLIQKAALLKNTILEFPTSYIGSNTTTNIQSGVMYSAIHGIEGMVENIKKELNQEIYIILTGGFSKLLSSRLSFKHQLKPNLTIEGLRIIYEEYLNE